MICRDGARKNIWRGANRTQDYLEGAAHAIFTNFRDQCTCILGALSENFAA
jgi:hypothetical protein